jgi:hypothetical protein
VDAPKFSEFGQLLVIGGNKPIVGTKFYVRGSKRTFWSDVMHITDRVYWAHGACMFEKDMKYTFAVALDTGNSRVEEFICEGDWPAERVLSPGDPTVGENWRTQVQVTQSVTFSFVPSKEDQEQIESVKLSGSWVFGSNPQVCGLMKVTDTLWLGNGTRYFPAADKLLEPMPGELTIVRKDGSVSSSDVKLTVLQQQLN